MFCFIPTSGTNWRFYPHTVHILELCWLCEVASILRVQYLGCPKKVMCELDVLLFVGGLLHVQLAPRVFLRVLRGFPPLTKTNTSKRQFDLLTCLIKVFNITQFELSSSFNCFSPHFPYEMHANKEFFPDCGLEGFPQEQIIKLTVSFVSFISVDSQTHLTHS